MRIFPTTLISLLLSACASGAGHLAPVVPSPGPGGPESGSRQQGQASYAEATEGFRAHPGVFTVHTSGIRLLYEIPRGQLGLPFLWVSQVSLAQEGTGYGGTSLGDRVVHWERRGDRVLLREESFGVQAPDSISPRFGVEAGTFPKVLAVFGIEAFGPDSSLVVDVTDLFTKEVSEFSPRPLLARGRQIRRFDPDRSFLERVSAFPENIEIAFVP